MAKKILILSASVGAGHMRAADALEKSFRQNYPGAVVKNIDVLEFTNPLFQKLYGKLYLDLIKTMPDVLGWIYDSLDKPWQKERRRLALDRLNTQPFIKFLKKEKPDIAVCTHFLPSEIISWLRAKNQIDTRQAIVVTDFDAHALWLCHNFEQYFVPLDETKVYLEKVGIPNERITAAGIPIDPIFAEHKNKSEMRRKHGLESGRLTILVSAGGFGVGKIEPLLRALSELVTPAQVVAICGRNEKLTEDLVELAGTELNNERVTFKPIGFTTEMDELMSAADIIVGKPGGLTTSESLAKGLIFVVVNPIPGQEERNSDHLLEQGCAIKCNNLPTLAYKIDKLAADESRMKLMRANIADMARPNSADHIANQVYGMIES